MGYEVSDGLRPQRRVRLAPSRSNHIASYAPPQPIWIVSLLLCRFIVSFCDGKHKHRGGRDCWFTAIAKGALQ